MDQTELDLSEILHILRRRIWLIILVPVLAAVTAGLVSLYLLKPVYSAETTLWVIKDYSNSQVNYNDILMSQNLTKTYAEVATSGNVLSGAIAKLKVPGLTVEQFQKKLTVTAVRDTQILSFVVEDGDPTMAAKMADAVAESFEKQIVGFMKVENVQIVDRAAVPDLPVRPRKTMNVAIAFVLGAMAGVGVVFLLEVLDTSIKSPEDVARYLGIPVVGSIPVIEGDAEPIRSQRSHARAQQSKTVVEK